MLKRFTLFSLIAGYILTTPLVALGPGGSRRASRNGSRFCGWALRAMGVRVVVRGKPQGGVIVANHLSYVDILTIISIAPCRFVTFAELRQTPGMGLMTAVSQTLFINRSKPSRVRADVALLEREMRRGVTIAFFPEGSSFDGSELHPFKSSLFESAIRTGIPVQPVCLRYTELDGEPVSLRNRHRVYYYGDMKLMSQLLGLLTLRSLTVEVVFEAPIPSAGTTRKELAERARGVIAKHFLPVQA